jgi:hypothetical protein
LVTKGKPCNAGHTYALVHPDGEVLPVRRRGQQGKQRIIGNIFDKNFKLSETPEKCLRSIVRATNGLFFLQTGKINESRG